MRKTTTRMIVLVKGRRSSWKGGVEQGPTYAVEEGGRRNGAEDIRGVSMYKIKTYILE